jgi:unsaturated chondroitin disaccharide hydrolase
MTIRTTPDWAIAAQEHAERKVMELAERVGGAFLHASVQGRYHPLAADVWTSGFWPGILLQVYRRTEAQPLLEMAKSAEDELEQAFISNRLYGLHHDIGFQFQATAVARYKFTGDPIARRRGLLATAFLMSRFNPAGNFIEAWNTEDRRGMAIIDTMMNLPLLFWAAEEFKQPRFRNVAEAHAETATRYFIREDGSTHHIIRLDQKTGAPIEALGGQGYAPDSCWSRGQSWAIYGFALAYRYTGVAAYLEVAKRIADSFIAALPPEYVPPWDFRVPDPSTAPRDSSAGAIAASGLLELASLLPDGAGEQYSSAAVNLLQALTTRCATWERPDQDGLLMHATGKFPANENVDVSLIYGDFYYLEALGKLAGLTETCW